MSKEFIQLAISAGLLSYVLLFTVIQCREALAMANRKAFDKLVARYFNGRKQ